MNMKQNKKIVFSEKLNAWKDEDENIVFKKDGMTEEEAKYILNSLFECYDCTDCELCSYCNDCVGCYRCFGCSMLKDAIDYIDYDE